MFNKNVIPKSFVSVPTKLYYLYKEPNHRTCKQRYHVLRETDRPHHWCEVVDYEALDGGKGTKRRQRRGRSCLLSHPLFTTDHYHQLFHGEVLTISIIISYQKQEESSLIRNKKTQFELSVLKV